uniref:Protein N-terminal glutamine amidohydrolase n=1 Tax=Ornithodoros turicata TaxID=34597 RepID=A0A2R5LAZ0_9ACAR
MEMTLLKDLHLPPRSECTYTSCYCEENVWKLCELVKVSCPDLLRRCFVVFVSNQRAAVPIWKQKSGTEENGLAVWDYHVLFIYCPADDRPSRVYDLDTVLPFPIDISTYIAEAFQPTMPVLPDYRQMFRVVAADEFLQTFASDRTRMRRPDGTWIREPPAYPCIRTSVSTNNIEDFICMDKGIGYGEVLSLQEFEEWFSR